jgi:hypothetical protein
MDNINIPIDIVNKIDKEFPSVEERGSKIFLILKKYFDSDEISDYDLDSFCIYWLASRAENKLEFAATEIIQLTRLFTFRHYLSKCNSIIPQKPKDTA